MDCFEQSKSVEILISIIMVILNIIAYAFLCFGIKNLYHNRNTIPLSVQIIYYITVLSFVIYCTCIGYEIISKGSKNCESNLSDIGRIWSSIYAFIYAFGLSHLYLLYLYRLKLTFQESIYALSKYTYIFLRILGLILIIVSIGRAVFGVIYFLSENAISIRVTTIILALFMPIYIIANGIVLYLYITKSVKMAKNSNNQNRKLYILKESVKYLNCVLVTLISTIIINVITYGLFNKIYAFYVIRIALFTDTIINIILLHLQFKYLNKWYLLLCHPFRIELNAMVNKAVKHSSVKLTVTTKTSSNDTSNNTNNNDSNNTNPSNSESPNVRGLEPTKSNEPNPNHLRSDDTDDNFVYNNPDKIYICRGCPIAIHGLLN